MASWPRICRVGASFVNVAAGERAGGNLEPAEERAEEEVARELRDRVHRPLRESYDQNRSDSQRQPRQRRRKAPYAGGEQRRSGDGAARNQPVDVAMDGVVPGTAGR